MFQLDPNFKNLIDEADKRWEIERKRIIDTLGKKEHLTPSELDDLHMAKTTLTWKETIEATVRIIKK